MKLKEEEVVETMVSKFPKDRLQKPKVKAKGGPPLLFDDMAPVEQRTYNWVFQQEKSIHQFHLKSTLRSEHLTSEL